jgi:hypothetical protein
MTRVFEKQSAEGDLGHREIDELLDFDAHDCVQGSSFCYVCEVQRAQRKGQRV